MDLRRFFLFVVFFLGTFFLLGNLALAKDDSSSSGTSENAAQSEASGDSVFDYAKEPAFKGLVPCGTDENNVPCSLCHFIIGIQRIFKYGLYLSTTLAFAGLFIIGLMYLFSFGSEEMMTKAKLFLWLTLKGFGITLGSWVIITSILNIVPISQGLGVNKVNWYTFSCNISTDNVGTGPANIDKGKLESLEIQCESGSASDITLDDDPNTDKPDNYQLKAIAKYSSGDSEDVTQKATWSAVDETIAKVSSGKVQGIKIGYTSIKASYAESGSESQAAGVNIFMNTCPLNLAPDDEEEEESEKTSSIFQYPLKPDNIFKKLTNSAYAASGGSGCKACVKKKTASSKCKLVAGNRNADFVFMLIRAKCGSFPNLEKDLFEADLCKNWNSKAEFTAFEKKVKKMSTGINDIQKDDRSKFAVYQLDVLYDGSNEEDLSRTIQSDCPNASNAKLMSYGFIYNNVSGKVAFAVFANKIAFYPLIFYGEDKNFENKIFSHEQIGHIFAQFRDEYSNFNNGDMGLQERLLRNSLFHLPYANVTRDKSCKKWKGITPRCFEGCDYLKRGCYRASDNSIMRYHTKEENIFNSVQNVIIHGCAYDYSACPPEELRETVIY